MHRDADAASLSSSAPTRLLVVDEIEALAGLAKVLKQLLLASYGLYPQDLAGEVASAARHLGGDDVMLLL
jgi:hypothetical protein